MEMTRPFVAYIAPVYRVSEEIASNGCLEATCHNPTLRWISLVFWNLEVGCP